MKRQLTVLGRLTALLLAVVLTAGLASAPASAAGAAHFTDVPASHWAFQYVERAYADGAIVGTGGDPAKGTGTFSPDKEMTYGEFLTMLASAFYPQELGRVSGDGPWYAPAIQVAVARQLNFNTQDQLMSLAASPINRYNAAWILVKILADKGAVLPTDQERAAAAAEIGDWDSLLEDGYWRYFVSAIYAAGIITGVDSEGTFSGEGHITRASAAVIYTRLADKLNADGGDPAAFQITFAGDWSKAPEGYQEALEEEFYTVYPRLFARFATANTARHIILWLLPIEEVDGYAGLTYNNFDWTRYQTSVEIRIADQYVDDWLHTAAIFAHELTHAATGTTLLEIKGENRPWFFECLADYALFRYAAWSDLRYMWLQESYYQPEDEALRTWDYEAYTDTHWFFAYMDEKYPTTADRYGLLDSILLAMRTGRVTTDGGRAQDDPDLNEVVREATGYASLEELRQQYVTELEAGTWTFDGFADYPDNYITENLPGVPNPVYFTPEEVNLCTGAHTYAVSGEAANGAADNLVDGNRATSWQASLKDVTADNLSYDAQHSLCVSLNKTVTFDTYTLCHDSSSRQTTVSWRLWYYDSNTDSWVKLDTVSGNTQEVTTRSFEPVTSQYIWLEVLNSGGDGAVRLYELELYDKR